MRLINKLLFWLISRDIRFDYYPVYDYSPIHEISQERLNQRVYRVGEATATMVSKSELEARHAVLAALSHQRRQIEHNKLVEAILGAPSLDEKGNPV